MSRPESKDPVEKVTITIPKSLKKSAQRAAEKRFMTLSAWVTERVREYFRPA